MTSPDKETREALAAILKATDGVFQIAAVHGYKWEGGSLVEPIMALIATSNNKLIQSIEDKLPAKTEDPHKGNIAYGRMVGHNRAITEVKAILESMKEK